MKTLPALLVSLLCAHLAIAQQTITGKITEEGDDFGLSGIVVTVKGTNVSTVTDVYGEYEIAVPAGATVLVFSGGGFNETEIEIGTQTSINFAMQKGKQKKEAKGTRFVPVGFGTQSKSEVTSSIAQIDAEQLEGIPTVDLEQANQGRASGIQIQNNGGQLGEGTSVRIRGGSSLSGSNEPLYVVDGVPLSSGGQSDINPHNIASIEILKDASAAAIYGSRAANGVVLITTKRGQSGKTRVDVDYQFGVSQTPKTLDLYTPDQYNAQLLEFGLRDVIPELEFLAFAGNLEALQTLFLIDDILAEGSAENYEEWARTQVINLSDGSSTPLSSNRTLNLIGQTLDSLIYDTDWQDEVYQTAFAHRANLGVSGGSEAISYYAGLSFLDQEGILIGNDFQRMNGRLDLNSEVIPGLDIDLSVNYAYTKNNRLVDNQDLGFPLQAIVLPPSDSYDPNDDYTLIVRSLEYNPLTEINFSDNLATGNNIIGDIGIAYEITDDLTFNVEGGVDFYDLDEEHVRGPETLEGNQTGLTNLTETSIRNVVYNAYLNYDLELSNNQRLSLLGGSSYQESTTETAFRSARVTSISELESLSENDPSLLNIPIPDTRFSFLSFYARATYNIQDKYIFQASGRADGSSRFSEDNRIGYFPAGSFGWNISNEDFFGTSVFNLMKLKASYGLVGNTPEEDFLYRSNYFEIGYGSQSGIRLSNLANSELKWETTAQLDVGLEFGLFKDRINATVDYYMKNTTDLLFPVPITQTTGFAFILQNIGSLTNSGFEFALNTVNIDNAFQWTTDFNITMNENQVTDLAGNQLIVGVNAYLEDQPAGVFYTRRYVGVDSDTGEALYDNGSGGTTTDWNSAPRMVVGNPNPDFFGGLSNTLTYEGFSLTFLFQFVYGVEVYNATREFLSNSGILNLGQTQDQINRWYKPGDEAPFPAVNPFQENTFPSSRFVEDGSYIRLNTATLTYNLPSEVVEGWGLSYLRFYVGGQNLITFTDYSGYDPDVNYVDPEFGTIERNISRNIDNFNIPQARTIITGFKIGL